MNPSDPRARTCSSVFFAGRLVAQVVDGDVHAVFGKLQRDAASDAAGTAGDERVSGCDGHMGSPECVTHYLHCNTRVYRFVGRGSNDAPDLDQQILGVVYAVDVVPIQHRRARRTDRADEGTIASRSVIERHFINAAVRLARYGSLKAKRRVAGLRLSRDRTEPIDISVLMEIPMHNHGRRDGQPGAVVVRRRRQRRRQRKVHAKVCVEGSDQHCRLRTIVGFVLIRPGWHAGSDAAQGGVAAGGIKKGDGPGQPFARARQSREVFESVEDAWRPLRPFRPLRTLGPLLARKTLRTLRAGGSLKALQPLQALWTLGSLRALRTWRTLGPGRALWALGTVATLRAGDLPVHDLFSPKADPEFCGDDPDTAGSRRDAGVNRVGIVVAAVRPSRRRQKKRARQGCDDRFDPHDGLLAAVRFRLRA